MTVAPLAPVEVSPRRGLGELQPDRDPPLIDTSTAPAAPDRLGRGRGVAAGLAGGVHLGPPWRAARNRPFGRAWRELRRLPADLPELQWRGAVRLFHEALNRERR